MAFSFSGDRIICGTQNGQVYCLTPVNCPSGPAILTAVNPEKARCPYCAAQFAPPPDVAGATKTPAEIQVPHCAFEDSRLLSDCPHCGMPLKFNPFFATADDYAEVLRRGLEHSRREKGDDHEETLAHLALQRHLPLAPAEEVLYVTSRN